MRQEDTYRVFTLTRRMSDGRFILTGDATLRLPSPGAARTASFGVISKTLELKSHADAATHTRRGIAAVWKDRDALAAAERRMAATAPPAPLVEKEDEDALLARALALSIERSSM